MIILIPKHLKKIKTERKMLRVIVPLKLKNIIKNQGYEINKR